MKAKLSEFINPEDFGVHYTPNYIDTDMLPNERMFISGLIKYYEPKHILEVGVAGGGGSVNILNTIMDMEADLTSIDICKMFNHPFRGAIEVGKFVKETFSELKDGKYRLLLGEDPSIVLPKLNSKFDFLVLDTGHMHPCESFNFLCILPYLTDEAIVVLHDISLYAFLDINTNREKLSFLATRILFTSICADKLLPKYDPRGIFKNIGAFQISKDTRNNIRNVFDSLLLPWEYWPGNIKEVSEFICKHYDGGLQEIFHDAEVFNDTLRKLIKQRNNKLDEFAKFFKNNAHCEIVFYGAGFNMRGILRNFASCKMEFNYKIWDINASGIGQLQGHNVTLPDFSTITEKDDIIIVTIGDDDIYNNLKEKFEALGYSVFHGIDNPFM